MELFSIHGADARQLHGLGEQISRQWSAGAGCQDGIYLNVEDNQDGQAFLVCRPQDGSNRGKKSVAVRDLYQTAADGIAVYIVREMESELLRRMLRHEYAVKSKEEAEMILKYSTQGEEEVLPESAVNAQLPLTDAAAGLRRTAVLAQEIRDYLQEHRSLHLTGFIQFRIHHYKNELREIAEYAMDEYLMDKQYQDFISLLKYFVYIQEAKIEEAHLIHEGPHEFQLLDGECQPLDTTPVEGLAAEMIDHDINFEDMIVSTLITVAPQTLCIHTREPDMPIIQTVRQIFGDRARLCTSCPMCAAILEGKRHPLHVQT